MSIKNDAGEHSQATTGEVELKEKLKRNTQAILDEAGPNWDTHVLATLTRQGLSRLLYLDFLYQKILDKAGIIMECGVHYGATLAALTNLRGIHEPYNYSRKIVGFDTFEGFAGSERLRDGALAEDGDYGVPEGWEDSLTEVLQCHVSNAPLAHVQQSFVVKGDARETVPTFLAQNPHQILSMVIFDMDIYSPTKAVLEAVKPRLMKGSILVFDEFNCDTFPGETQAFLEVFNPREFKALRHPHAPHCAYVEV